MEKKRHLIFDIYETINGEENIICKVNYSSKNDSSNIEVLNETSTKLLIPISNNGKDLNWDEIMKFFKSRLFNENDKEKLKEFGLKKFDLFKLLKITEGKRSNDCFSVKMIKY